MNNNLIHAPAKIFIVMKLIVFLTLFFNLSVTAGAYSQRITLSVEQAPLEKVLQEIRKQSGYAFFLDAAYLNKALPVTAKIKRKPVEEALEIVFQDQPFGYQINDRIIIMRPREKVSLVLPLQHTVRGRVTDTTGAPLPGATVRIKGTAKGISTDPEGNFTMEAGTSDTLEISFIGYLTREVPVQGRTSITVRLQEDIAGIDEVVVVGYGTQKKINLTGAADQVSSEVLQSRPITNVSRGLQGIIPNLNVANSGGNPNSEPNLNIRGTTSINGGSPLVLVDNVQMDLNLINPDDIESITVLKDAASAAIYGARGAFGVILVTLKKGARKGKPVINYSGGMEFNKPTYLPDMLSTLEYMEATNAARERRFGSVTYSEQQLEWARAYAEDPVNNPVYHMQPNGSIFWHANVDNFSEMLQDLAPAQNHSLNVNGGSERISYYASLGYRNQEGMFRDATDMLKRYNVLLNLNTHVTDWLIVGFKASYTNKNYDEPHRYVGKGSSWWEQMTRGVPQILFPVSTPPEAPIPNAPTAHFYNFLTSGSRNVTGTDLGLYSVNTEIDLAKGLKFKGDFNYQRLNENVKDVRKEFGYIRDKWEYQYGHTTPSFVTRRSNQSDYFAANAYLTYDKTVQDDHNFSALLGFNQEWQEMQNFDVQGNSLITNEVPVLSLSGGDIFTGDEETDWAIRGVFGRLTYNYRQKYLFEVNARYDGTSRFPKESRFHLFPSLSAGWRISEEAFMAWTGAFLDDLKLRVSYGSLGNQNLTSAYPYITSFGVINPINYLLGNGTSLGLTPPGLVSPDLTWETTSTIDFGVDISLFGKISISYDWYKRTTSDMLVAGEKLPAVLGVDVPSRNGAELKTVGGELSVKYMNRTGFGLAYDLGVVVSDYQATITKYDNNPNKLHTTYYEGQKLGEIWGYETVGIFQTEEEVAGAPDHAELAAIPRIPGDIRFADLNGDGKINFGDNTASNPGDQKIIGNSTPRYQFGITGNFKWKGFDLRLFFQGIAKRDIYPTGNYFWGQINNNAAVGTREVYYNSWTEENTGAFYPVYKQSSAFNIQTQTRYLQKASYIRMKNLTLGYSLQGSLINKISIQKLRVYFSGENLWERSGLKGNFDPEVIPNGNLGQFYPLQRTLSFGLQVVL